MKIDRRWRLSSAMDVVILLVAASFGFLLAEVLVTAFNTPFASAVLACSLLATITGGFHVAVYRAAMRRLGLDNALSGIDRELVRSETASITGPLTTVATLGLGAAIGLAGLLGGEFTHPLIGLARGMLFTSAITGALVLGDAYVRLERARDPLGEPARPVVAQNSPSYDPNAPEIELAAWFAPRGCALEDRPAFIRSGTLRLLLFCLTIALMAVSSYAPFLVSVSLLYAWLAAFALLLRVHRTKLWHVSQLFTHCFVMGVVILGVIAIHLVNPAQGISFWTIAGIMAAIRLLVLPPRTLERPPVVVGPTATMMVVDRVLIRRAAHTQSSTASSVEDRAASRHYTDGQPNKPAALDYSGLVLHSRDFSGQSLNFASFKDADLRYCKFENCHMEGVDFTNANLESTSFKGATLAYAVLCGADVTGADFSNSKMLTSDVTGCRFSRANLYGAFFRGLWFDQTTTWPENTNLDFVRTKRGGVSFPPPMGQPTRGVPA